MERAGYVIVYKKEDSSSEKRGASSIIHTRSHIHAWRGIEGTEIHINTDAYILPEKKCKYRYVFTSCILIKCIITIYDQASSDEVSLFKNFE